MAASRNYPSTDQVVAVLSAEIGRYVEPGQSVAVGYSGGLDSTVLLHGLSRMSLCMSAVHVHHGLNPAADAWVTACERRCEALRVPLTVARVSVERNSPDGLEAAARRARHQVFSRLATDWIVLAHHRGDRAETLVFNLLRGAGVRGAGAMRSRQGRLLRPMLSLARPDLLAYARQHDLDWVEDDSNHDLRHSRNFLRHAVLPRIAERFPAVEARLAASAERFAEAADLLDELAIADLRGYSSAFPVPVAVLAGLPEPRARNLLRHLLTAQGVGIPSHERLAEALQQVLNAGVDRRPRICFGQWVLTRRRGLVCLDRVES